MINDETKKVATDKTKILDQPIRASLSLPSTSTCERSFGRVISYSIALIRLICCVWNMICDVTFNSSRTSHFFCHWKTLIKRNFLHNDSVRSGAFWALTRRRLFWSIKGHVIRRNHFLHERCRHRHEQYCAVQRLAGGRGNFIRKGWVKNGFKLGSRLFFLKWFVMTWFLLVVNWKGGGAGDCRGFLLLVSTRGGQSAFCSHCSFLVLFYL